jgi:hypothetical protein
VWLQFVTKSREWRQLGLAETPDWKKTGSSTRASLWVPRWRRVPENRFDGPISKRVRDRLGPLMEIRRVRLNLRGFTQGYDPENASKTLGNYSRRVVVGGAIAPFGPEKHPLLKRATSGSPALPSPDQQMMKSMVMRPHS